jgi:spore maturation protein CgeB
MPMSSAVRRAFAAYREGHYAVALEAYRALAVRLGVKNFQLNIRLCEDQLYRTPRQRLAALPAKRLKVAAVMDEFTFHCYDPECHLLQLHPKNCLEQLETFKPDLLFIESAWEGLDQLWKGKISSNSQTIQSCVRWCKAHEIPTLFWSKEDPVHFDTFVPLAKQVDFIFTTDIDCIPRYKYHAGHDRVFLLPFAAQPKLHNPIECYERKDAFNFAGSYYLKYPERQRDFAALIEAVKESHDIDIYDRHADEADPRFAFPDAYKPMILGKLPFAEIDRAYKGYRYGINLNTVKQSQTMFARRIFELLASNTVVISNFSRGARLMFGEAVISSDEPSQLRKRLESISRDDATYRKFRLGGLRKVMREHTYAHRLAYIRSKITTSPYTASWPPVLLLGRAKNPEQLQRLVVSFHRQQYPNKRLFVTGPEAKNKVSSNGIEFYPDIQNCLDDLRNQPEDTLLGTLEPSDHYGANYLCDLALATRYSHASAFGKISYYRASSSGIELVAPGQQYRPAMKVRARAGLACHKALDDVTVKACLETPDKVTFEMADMLGVDEFNYIENGYLLADELKTQSEDLPMADQSAPFPEGYDIIAASQPTAQYSGSIDSGKLAQIAASELHDLIPSKGAVQLNLVDDKLEISSNLESDKIEYLYARTAKTREEMNLVFNSQYKLECETNLDLMIVFEFYDKDGKKIISQSQRAVGRKALAIPAECSMVRFGLRIKGPGKATIDKLILTHYNERPTTVICRSQNLVLSKYYPDYAAQDKYAFLHKKIGEYRKSNMVADVFLVNENEPNCFREYENMDIAVGDLELLSATLASGQIKHLLVDFSDGPTSHIL